MSHSQINELPEYHEQGRYDPNARDSYGAPPTAVALHHLHVTEEQVARNMIFDVASEIVVYISPSLEIQWANRAACGTSGKALEHLKGKPCREIWGGEGCKAHVCPVKQALRRKEPVMHLATDPKGRTWIMHGIPVMGSSGDPVGAIEIIEKAGTPEVGETMPDGFRDLVTRLVRDRLQERIQANAKLLQFQEILEAEIEERLNIEWKLRMLTDQMQSLNQAKSRFLANMGSEIRTPLSAMLGYLDMMSETQLTFLTRWQKEQGVPAIDMPEELAETFKYITLLRNNARHLLSMLESILDISKLEIGRRKVERFICATILHVKQTLDVVQPVADAKNLKLRLIPETSIPETIRTDPGRLREVLIYLLGIVIQMSRSGEVQLRMATSSAWEEQEKLLFEITTEGEIDESTFKMMEEQEFPPVLCLGELDLAVTPEMAIGGCRKIVQLLGGELTCETDPRLGCRFSFTVDTGSLQGVARIEPEEMPPLLARLKKHHFEDEDLPMLAGSVLLATDRSDPQQVVCAYLRRAGLKVQTVHHGKEILNKVTHQDMWGFPFDLVLMDLHMPNEDVFRTIETLREHGFGIPVVAMISEALDNPKEICREKGFSGWLIKPFSYQELYYRLRTFLPVRDCEAEGAENRDTT
jgi:signal transduction histidine kinase